MHLRFHQPEVEEDAVEEIGSDEQIRALHMVLKPIAISLATNSTANSHFGILQNLLMGKAIVTEEAIIVTGNDEYAMQGRGLYGS